MSIRRISLLLVVFLLVVLPVPVGAQEAPALTQYVLVARLDYDAASLTVDERVRYRNLTGESLSSVVFQVTSAAFEAFELRRVQVGAQPVDTRLDGTVLDVPLPRALAPGDEVSLDIDFVLNVPREGGRLGAVRGVIALGNWFPILSIYRTPRLTGNGQPPGWSRHQYVDTGDAFFTEVASYDVTLDADRPVTVAFPGTLVRREGNSWHIRAEKMRDFALAISDSYRTVTRQVEGTTVSAFYLPGHERTGEEYVDAAEKMLVWMNRAVLRYPYPSLVLAEMYGPEGVIIGQEYPGLIFVDQGVSRLGGGVESYLAYLVNHEVAHMWFYALVGNDQLYEPWLDEGMATWLSLVYYRANHPDLFPRLWNERQAASLESTLGRVGVRPLNTGIYDYSSDGQYSTIIYRRAAAFIEDLAQAIGPEEFLRALGRYASVVAFKVATSTSFLDFMQEQTETSLSPLYARYFSFSRYGAGEPWRAQLEAPQSAAQSALQLELAPRTDAPRRVFLDDRPLPHRDQSGGLQVDLSSTPPGDYVLTVLLSGPNAAAKDLVSRVTVVRPGDPTPVASAPAVSPAASPSAPAPSPLPVPLPVFLAVDAVVLLLIAAGAFFILRRPRR